MVFFTFHFHIIVKENPKVLLPFFSRKHWKFWTHQGNSSSFLAQAGRWDFTFRTSRMLEVTGFGVRWPKMCDVHQYWIGSDLVLNKWRVSWWQVKHGIWSFVPGWLMLHQAGRRSVCARLHAWHQLATRRKTSEDTGLLFRNYTE